MTVLTASTPDQSSLVDIQKESCLLNGIEKERHIVVPIDKKYPRPYSWFKIQALLHHLHYHDFILWMDSDSMMVLPTEQWHGLLDQKHSCFLARDINGWNCGVMVWRRCPEAFEALWKIYDSFDKFRDHPWFEQGAFHTMAEAINPMTMPKVIFNAYPKDRTSSSAILHWPDHSFADRLHQMDHQLSQLRNRKP